MRRFQIAAVVVGFAFLGAAPAGAQQAPPDRTATYRASDPQMNAATAEARRTLPVFWRRFETMGPKNFVLKVRFDAAHGGGEAIWVSDIERHGDVLTGAIADDPQDLPDLKMGQRVTFELKAVHDWGYRANGKRYGYYTSRVMLSRMSAKEAAPYWEVFAPTPLEPEKP
jgi:uncharacterized protein YegJ (DUF2314 family)